MGRVVSIDFGLKRLGVAISDERKIIATSLGTVEAERKSDLTADKIVSFLVPYAVERIVVGFPYKMNGQVGFLADEVKHFISLLEKRVSCPIVIWDERLSSVQAERTLREANMNRKKRKGVIDAVSAVILLQSFLEANP